ncbi:WD40/YVTN/BNR-like repeat-containing protein [Wenxinia saemankumensis]|uniref:BNR/Asp-box repeat-containing protein n=1 Tax=Wenxinia saemankumensis TaxID=1447782 RepID=A0A1M6ENU2_9RHOB|nr:exo-alpha-sialidase [Wenxinia saemankumensis]SHI86940.1 hypothetical protein SAMN05444417_2086 [Wenxinia saemankumensis]
MSSTATTLLIGTTKGLFLLKDDGDGWSVSGPHCHGWPINHAAADPARGTIWACGGNEFFGSGVWRSADGGESWELSKFSKGQMDDWLAAEPEMAATFGMIPGKEPIFSDEIHALWSLERGPDALYAGAKPAQLFRSFDDGANWEKVQGLTDHPSAEGWSPGGAGLTLHSIVTAPDDPKKVWVGISAAGVFATEDGGATWERRNRIGNAGEACGHDHPAAGEDGQVGFCVHNIGRAAGATGDRLYQQNHHGVFRSVDGGRSWDDITAGLPSTFGFPIGIHPSDPDTIWTMPLNGDTQGRFPPEAKAAIWKSTDGGQSWAAKRQGLPQDGCYFTVLRQAMAVGEGEPAGVFFGTNSGSIFASRDEGESWDEIARHLPTVLSVEVMQ